MREEKASMSGEGGGAGMPPPKAEAMGGRQEQGGRRLGLAQSRFFSGDLMNN
jgi:hypothetical protein